MAFLSWRGCERREDFAVEVKRVRCYPRAKFKEPRARGAGDRSELLREPAAPGRACDRCAPWPCGVQDSQDRCAQLRGARRWHPGDGQDLQGQCPTESELAQSRNRGEWLGADLLRRREAG